MIFKQSHQGALPFSQAKSFTFTYKEVRVYLSSRVLPSFTGLKEYDASNSTAYFELVRNNFSRFVKSLIKADGTVSSKEKEKSINRLLFPSGEPPEDDGEGEADNVSHGHREIKRRDAGAIANEELDKVI